MVGEKESEGGKGKPTDEIVFGCPAGRDAGPCLVMGDKLHC